MLTMSINHLTPDAISNQRRKK